MALFTTADLTAAARSLHQRLPERIFDDPYARHLRGPFFDWIARLRPLEWAFMRFVIGPLEPVVVCVLMRARYAEHALEQAAEADDVSQYVILGAGMDSFSLRRPDLMERLDLFEIDLPDSQALKKKRFAKAGLPLHPRLHLVSADLRERTVAEALEGTGFDRSRPAFLSLMGLAYYLSPDDLTGIARAASDALAPGTRIAVDYLLDEPSCPEDEIPMRSRLLAFVAKRSEPMRSSFAIAGMDALMADQRFEPVESATATHLAESYRAELGGLSIRIPGIFGLGHYRLRAA